MPRKLSEDQSSNSQVDKRFSFQENSDLLNLLNLIIIDSKNKERLLLMEVSARLSQIMDPLKIYHFSNNDHLNKRYVL